MYAKQSINLTGLGSPFFDAYIDFIAQVHSIFEHGINGSLDPWLPDVFEGHTAISLANRFYTNKHDKGQELDLPFGPAIDPHGVLERGKDNLFVHLPENQVKYYKFKKMKSGSQ